MILVLSVASSAGAVDRLDRFRQLAAGRLATAEANGDGGAGADVQRELLGLVDEEIVESLASGGVFADTEFLRERLDGFAEAWGGASLRITRVGRLVVGAFHLGEGPGPGFVHVYGTLRGEAALLATLSRDGRPTVHPMPAAPGGAAQFVVAWEGASTGRGSRALRLELVRQRGDGVGVVWSAGGEHDEPLMASEHRVLGGEITVRYELHYPGWTPGCARQTEQEDVYRLAPTGIFVRVSRHQRDAWHLALHRTAARLFAALAGHDRSALAAVVPDAALRARLPASLVPEPACDAVEGTNPTAASVAAAGDEGPWALTFRRAGGRWRLSAVRRVLE